MSKAELDSVSIGGYQTANMLGTATGAELDGSTRYYLTVTEETEQGETNHHIVAVDKDSDGDIDFWINGGADGRNYTSKSDRDLALPLIEQFKQDLNHQLKKAARLFFSGGQPEPRQGGRTSVNGPNVPGYLVGNNDGEAYYLELNWTSFMADQPLVTIYGVREYLAPFDKALDTGFLASIARYALRS